MPSKTIFQESWKKSFPWVTEAPMRTHARCKYCRKLIDICSMGVSALRSHAKGTKHLSVIPKQDTVPKLLGPVQQPRLQSQSSDAPQLASNSKSTEPDSVPPNAVQMFSYSKKETTKAELIWVFNLIDKSYSFSSSSQISMTFQHMFNDSAIASSFSCSETKAQYLCNFALAPHAKTALYRYITESKPGYSVLFDESLNSVLQKKQLDFHIRLWDMSRGTISTRYLTSLYLGKACTIHLLDSFKGLDIDLKEMIQVGMDGPNVNISTLRKLDSHMKDVHGTNLLNVGSCGLHQVHNAFKGAFTGQTLKDKATGCDWNIGKFLHALHIIFDDCPARRADYEKITKSMDPLYPLNFCAHRWLENCLPAKRALEMIPDLHSFVEEVTKPGNKYTKPSCVSFQVVCDFIKDPLAKARLAFFISFAKPLEKFLQKYQTDKAMIMFIGHDLENLLLGLIKRFVKKEDYVDKRASDISILDDKIHKNHKQIDVGFSAGELLKDKKISELMKMGFCLDAKKSMLFFVQKINEKSPLQYSLIRNLKCLQPDYILKSSENATAMFQKCVQSVNEANLVDIDRCETAIQEFRDFTESSGVECLKDFNQESKEREHRIDYIYFSIMSKSYPSCWAVISKLLLLSHSQATVERGFSINKEILTTNMSAETLNSRRMVKDYICYVGGMEKVPDLITDKLISSGTQAHSRYKVYLEERKKENKEKERGQKRAALQDEVQQLIQKKKRLIGDKELLLKDSYKESDKAENTACVRFITKANALRRAALDKSKEIETVEKQIEVKSKLLEADRA